MMTLVDFKTDPYEHQEWEFVTAVDSPARALLWQMRTGKSKQIIDTACFLHRVARSIDCVILFAPNGVHDNWIRRQLPEHHWDSIEYNTIVWRTSVAGTAAASEQHEMWWQNCKTAIKLPELLWAAFNSESMTRPDVRKVISALVRHRRVLMVFDESDDFRTPGSKRTKMARAIAKKCPFKRILTASVITNSPLNAYSQYELLEPKALGFGTYDEFKKHHAVYDLETTRGGRRYPKLSHYTNLDQLQERMAPWSSLVLRSDCEDLPEVIRSVRQIKPSNEQLRLYRELHKAFVVELNGKQVSVGENTARMMKLQQVLSGFLVDEYKDVHIIPGGNPRLEALSDEVYLAPGKVIVWCQFRVDLDAVSARLRADGHSIVEYHGRVGSEDKQRSIDTFQNDPSVKGIVAQPGAGGRGINLSAADMIINYSHTFNAIHREQSSERATAIAGSNVSLLDLMGPGIDPYIREKVDNNVSVADAVAGNGMRDFLMRAEL